METTDNTFTAHLTPAGDVNSQFVVTLPPDATEALIEHYAAELRGARGEIEVSIGDREMRDLDVEQLLTIEGELQRALTAVAVLLKARPPSDWGEPNSAALDE